MSGCKNYLKRNQHLRIFCSIQSLSLVSLRSEKFTIILLFKKTLRPLILHLFSDSFPMCSTTSHSKLFSTYRFYHKLDLTILTPTATMEPLPYLTFLITLLILLVSVQGHSDGPPIKVR